MIHEENKKKDFTGTVCILLAAALWGCMSLTVRPLGDVGFSALQMTFLRATLATVIIAVILLAKDKTLFKIKWKHLPLFIASGVISFLFFNFCYMSSIEENSVSVAAILLYTSPVWITILSRIIFKEKITLIRIISLTCALGGAAMLSLSGTLRITGIGVLYGIGSGLGYALYSVFGKIAAKYYKPETATFYTLLFAAVFSIPICKPFDIPTLFSSAPISAAYIVAATVFCTVLPYILFTKGLSFIPAGKAGVIAIAEPVVAAIIGWIFYGEALGVLGITGIVVVCSALVFMQIMENRKPKETRKQQVKKT